MHFLKIYNNLAYWPRFKSLFLDFPQIFFFFVTMNCSFLLGLVVQFLSSSLNDKG